MDRVRTIRVDLTETVTEEVVLSWLQQRGFARALVSREVGTKTGKPHLQGWVQLPETMTDSAWAMLLCRWKKSVGLDKTQASTAQVKKEEYFWYVLKEGNVAWATGVTDEEIRQWSEKAYEKPSERVKRESIVAKVTASFERQRNFAPRRADIAREVLREYLYRDVPLNRHVVEHQVEAIWLKLRGERGVELLAIEWFGMSG